MAIYLNNNVYLLLNSVDLSVYVKSITVNQSFDEVDVTAMGPAAHVMAKGLESGSFDIVLLNDLASAKVNATLQAAWGTTVPIVAKQINAVVGATNPTYTSTILINNLAPINGAPGDYSEQTLKFTANSAIVYAIA